MDIKRVELAKHILETITYLEMDEEETKLVVEYEVELYKPKVDAMREHSSKDEIEDYIHNLWTDYEIADETEDVLIEYIRG